MDTIFDIMISLLGAFFMFLSLIFIPEIKNSRKYKSITIIAIIILLIVGIGKAFYDRGEEKATEVKRKQSEGTIKSLKITLTDLKEARKQDSIERAKFEVSLENKFHIIRDSLNQPKQISNTYNLRFDRANVVKVGGN